MRETSLPDLPAHRIEQQAWAIGFAAFGMLGAGIYGAGYVLSRLVGSQGADLLITIPAFFACLVIAPAARRAERRLRRHWCARNGGHAFAPVAPTVAIEECARCKAALRRQGRVF